MCGALSGDDEGIIERNERMLNSIALISVGAALGAVLRWLLGLGLDSLFPAIPPGTLAANLVGGYLIGVAIEVLSLPIGLGPELKLLLITGFLGGLTTFSTFSGEVARLLQQGRLALAGAEIALHVVGSVALTILGIATVMALRRAS
jgi:CrcB protein